MKMLVLGVIAFAVMAIGDLNDAFFKKRPIKLCFPLGLVMLCLATAARLSLTEFSVLWCAAAAVFLVLELYALFGSFSVSEAYTATDVPRQTCDNGLYSLCRHPGIPPFACLYICLHFGAGLPLLDALVYIFCDLLLAVFEDTVIFPRILGGYDDYKKRVPFIIPRFYRDK